LIKQLCKENTDKAFWEMKYSSTVIHKS